MIGTLFIEILIRKANCPSIVPSLLILPVLVARPLQCKICARTNVRGIDWTMSMRFKTPRFSSALPFHQPTNLTIYHSPISEEQRCLIPTPSIPTLTISIIFQMSGLKYWPGYRHLSLGYATRTFKITELMM